MCRGRIERGRHKGSTHVCKAIVLSKNIQAIQGIYESRFEHSIRATCRRRNQGLLNMHEGRVR